jgi:hypothetical protein
MKMREPTPSEVVATLSPVADAVLAGRRTWTRQQGQLFKRMLHKALPEP